MPKGFIVSDEQVLCTTCTKTFTKKHYNSKFCSKECYHKDIYRKQRNTQLNKGYILKKAYGITLDDFNALQKEQNFKCKICYEQPRILYVDHCHAKGHVRGLLCRTCNLLLGHAKDSLEILETAREYLADDLRKQKGVA